MILPDGQIQDASILGSPQATTMAVLARLASVIAYPPDDLAEDELSIGSPALVTFGRMTTHPAFQWPVRRAIRSHCRGGAGTVDAEIVGRLASASQSRVAALIVASAASDRREAAMLAAAAVFWRRFTRIALKNERQHARAVLGEDAFTVATREAPLLHPTLGDIEQTFPVAYEDGDLGTARESVIETGMAVLASFVAKIEPTLAYLLPGGVRKVSEATSLSDFLSLSHCDHLVRLFRRRMRPWAPIIA